MNKIKLGKLRTRAAFQPKTLDEETRTVDVTWTTGHKGLRNGWDGKYYEELSLDPKHVTMDVLSSGRAKFLDNHNTFSNDAVIGVIERASLGKSEGRATVRFARDEISERNFQKVKDGILTDVSVGYFVEEYTETTRNGESIPTYLATRWKPIEVSLVPMGFDPGATVRSDEQTEELNEVVVIRRQEDEMTPEQLKQAKAEEKKRASDIRAMVRAAGLQDSLADDMIDRDLTVDQARSNVESFTRAIEESNKVQIQNTVRVELGESDQDKKRGALVDALAHRIDGTFKPQESARIFAGRSLISSVEHYLGRRLGETDATLAKRAMSTSDFPLILANSAEKAALNRYTLAPRTYGQWTSRDTLRNYKEAARLRAGDFSGLVERGEHEEFQYGSFGEERELFSLKDFGIIHKFTERMMVNDDLKMIQAVSNEGGVAAARLENQLAYSALRTNKVMGDGVALYHASHNNLLTAGAIGETSFGEAFKSMRKQKTVDGKDTLNISPRFLIVGPDQEVAARKFLATIQPTQTSNVNIFSGMVELIVDSQIPGNEYYFVADPNAIPGVCMLYLEGRESPRIDSRVNWSDNSIELKVDHAVNAAPVDWRALSKNPGQ